MSAMKNVAIALDEILEVLRTLPENQQDYLVRELPEANARRQADELGIDVPSEYTAYEFMTLQRDPERKAHYEEQVLGDGPTDELWAELNKDGPVKDYWEGPNWD